MESGTLIASQWRITHGSGDAARVLISFEDLCSAEIGFSWHASGEAAGVAGAAFAVQKTYRNAENTITIPLVRDFDTMAAARAHLLALVASLSDAVADTVIESAEGGSYTLRAARITSANPRIEEGRRVACDYVIAGGKVDSGEDSTDELGDTAPLDSGDGGDTGEL